MPQSFTLTTYLVKQLTLIEVSVGPAGNTHLLLQAAPCFSIASSD